MRIILLGTGSFAVPTLRALKASPHALLLAVTRPPRGRKPCLAPVELAAEELGIECWHPETVNSDAARAQLAAMRPDLLVVCDYGEILQRETLQIAPLGAVNLHGSLLPKYRGAAPVQWAVLNGETETGNTVIQMTAGLDAGPCLAVQRVAIDADETAWELESRLARMGGELVLQVVDELAAGTSRPWPQDKSQATKAPRLSKSLGQIDWSRSAIQIKNQVRALQPWPRAYCDWRRANGELLRLIVHRADPGAEPAGNAQPGTVVNTGATLSVACGAGVLDLLEIQPAGRRMMAAEEFLRGYPVHKGDLLTGD